jgi:hypothetical protein
MDFVDQKNQFDLDHWELNMDFVKVKKSELQNWSLQIFSFQRNSRSQRQSPYFELYK